MTTPFFSIITCTYNSSKYLEKNIISIKNQNFRDFEHIFIDGFSTDNTIDIIKKYQAESPNQVKIFQFNPEGISKAMNQGIENSTGRYLIHLHSDDCFFDDEVLNDVKKFLTNHNYPDWIFGRELHLNDEKELGIYPKFTIYTSDSRYFYSKSLLGFTNYIRHQTVFIKKDVFNTYGLFREDLKCVMDVEMWLRIKNKTRWLFFDRLITKYLYHSEAQSTGLKNIENNNREYHKIHHEYLSFFPFLIFLLIDNLLKLKNINKQK